MYIFSWQHPRIAMLSLASEVLHFTLELANPLSASSWFGDSLDMVSYGTRAVASFGYDFVKTLFVYDGTTTQEMVIKSTKNDLAITYVDRTVGQYNMFEDVAGGVKNVYHRGIRGNTRAAWNHATEHPFGVTNGVLMLATGSDASGYASLSRFVLNLGRSAHDVVTGLPKAIAGSRGYGDAAVTAVFFIGLSSLPAVSAYNSVAEARAAYPETGSCSSDTGRVACEIRECINYGDTLSECYEGAVERHTGHSLEGYSFQMHPSESDPSLSPVSITNYGDGRICVISGVSPDGMALRVCGPFDFSGDLTVETTSMEFAKAHEGLEPGQMVLHAAARLEDTRGATAIFVNAKASLELSTDQAICVIGAPGGAPQQMCFDPSNHAVSVKGLTHEQFLRLAGGESPEFQIIRPGDVMPAEDQIIVSPDDGRDQPTVMKLDTSTALVHVPTDCKPSLSLWNMMTAYIWQDPKMINTGC